MYYLLALLALASTTLALTFTSPFTGSTVNFASSYKITWIPAASDPSTFTLEIFNAMSGASVTAQTIATDVETSAGSYTIPANTIIMFGSGFELVASSMGKTIGSTGAFSLGDGMYTLQTGNNGVLTISTVGSPVATSAAAATTTGSTAASSAVSESSASSSKPTGKTASSTASPKTSSSVRASSTRSHVSSSTSSPASSSSSATATKSSSSSNSNGNLGFDSAADMIRGSVIVSCAAILGALAVLV